MRYGVGPMDTNRIVYSSRSFRVTRNPLYPPFKCRITKRQVRSGIDRLFARKFFSRITYARRQTYYSNRLNASQLAESILKQKTRRFTVVEDRTKSGH